MTRTADRESKKEVEKLFFLHGLFESDKRIKALEAAMFAPQVLVVSCHLSHSKPLALALERIGVRMALAFSAEQASRMLTADEIPVLCCCARLPDGDYRSMLGVIKSRKLTTRLLVVGEAPECTEYLQAMEAGAFDFVPMPCQMEEVERILHNALEPEIAQAVAVSSLGRP